MSCAAFSFMDHIFRRKATHRSLYSGRQCCLIKYSSELYLLNYVKLVTIVFLQIPVGAHSISHKEFDLALQLVRVSEISGEPIGIVTEKLNS